MTPMIFLMVLNPLNYLVITLRHHLLLMIIILFRLIIMIMMRMTCSTRMMRLKLKITSLKNVLRDFNSLAKQRRILKKMLMQIPMMKNLNSIKLKEQLLWPKYLKTHMMIKITKRSKLILINFNLVKKQKPQNFQAMMKKL